MANHCALYGIVGTGTVRQKVPRYCKYAVSKGNFGCVLVALALTAPLTACTSHPHPHPHPHRRFAFYVLRLRLHSAPRQFSSFSIPSTVSHTERRTHAHVM